MPGKRIGPGASTCFDPRGIALRDALRAVAEEMSATPAQVALAWLMPSTGHAHRQRDSLEQPDDILGAAWLALPASVTAALGQASAAER